jgi:alpha-1,2-mannosyltransferase
MQTPNPSAPGWHRWVPWLCGLAAFGLAAKNLIGAYADLGIYLDVAREFRQGGIDIFRDRAPAGPWLYPHFAALPLAGLQLLLPDAGIRWVWCAGLGLATALLLRDTARAVTAGGGLRPWQWLVFGLLFQRCIAQNLTHGQLSLWVGACVAAGIVQLQRRNDLGAGVWLGVAAALKLTPILFLPALPLMRRWRAAGWMLATIAVAVLLVPWPFCGTSEHGRHLCDFWRTITESLTAPDQAAIVQYRAGPSIGGTLDHLLQARPIDRAGRTVHLVDLGPTGLAIAKALWSTCLGALLAALFWRARRHGDGVRLALQASAVLLATVFFAPLVRVYHLAAAVLPLAWFCRGPRARHDWLWWCAALGALFALTLRQRKLLGESLWRTLEAGGLLHFTLVAMLVWLVRDCGGPDTGRR